jgi:hypothetical protein
MFGLIRPCPHVLNDAGRATYRAHMCGACLSLRDDLGQPARPALNRDALVLSLLAEHIAAAPDLARTAAGRCPMRSMRRATVLDPASSSARYAAMVSMILLQASIKDHAQDGDRGSKVARIVTPVVSRYGRQAVLHSQELGVDLSTIEGHIMMEREIRAKPGLGLSDYLRYTEAAFAAGFAGVATIAHVPATAPTLERLGRAYGATAALIDAFEDYEEDRKRSQFNLLTSSWPEESKQEQWRRGQAEVARQRDMIETSLTDLDVQRDNPIWGLLVGALGNRVETAVGGPRPKHLDQPSERTALGNAGPAATRRRRSRLLPLATVATVVGTAQAGECLGDCCGEFCSTICDATCSDIC